MSKYPCWSALGIGAGLPFSALILTLALWQAMPVAEFRYLFQEGHGVEQLTELLYVVLAAGIWLMPHIRQDKPMAAAMSIVLLGLGAREADLHRAWSSDSVLKVSYHIEHAGTTTSIVALLVIGCCGAAVLYLAAKGFKALRSSKHRWHEYPSMITFAAFICVLVVTKVLDRSVNILREDFAYSVPFDIAALVMGCEESLELTMPLLLGWSLLKLGQGLSLDPAKPQAVKLRKAGSRG